MIAILRSALPWTPVALLLILGLGAGACVSSGTHEELQKDHEALKKTLAETQQSLKGEQSKVKALEGKRQSLEEALSEAEAEHTRLSAEQKRLSDELAALVKDKSKLKDSVDDMKKALEELSKRKAAAEKRIAEYKNLLERFKKLIDAGKLKVKIVDGRMVVELATDVLFASGKAALSDEGTEAINEVAAVLATIPGRAFQVEGHTDNVPIKTAKYPSNWELAAARSLTVVKTMVAAEMPQERISAASFGESKPAGGNDTPEGRAANRRIEIVLVPDLSSLPGFDELSKVSGS